MKEIYVVCDEWFTPAESGHDVVKAFLNKHDAKIFCYDLCKEDLDANEYYGGDTTSLSIRDYDNSCVVEDEDGEYEFCTYIETINLTEDTPND